MAAPEPCVLDPKLCLRNWGDSGGIGKRLETKVLHRKLGQTWGGLLAGGASLRYHVLGSCGEAALSQSGLTVQAVPRGTGTPCKARFLVKDLEIGRSGDLDSSRVWRVPRLA